MPGQYKLRNTAELPVTYGCDERGQPVEIRYRIKDDRPKPARQPWVPPPGKSCNAPSIDRPKDMYPNRYPKCGPGPYSPRWSYDGDPYPKYVRGYYGNGGVAATEYRDSDPDPTSLRIMMGGLAALSDTLASINENLLKVMDLLCKHNEIAMVNTETMEQFGGQLQELKQESQSVKENIEDLRNNPPKPPPPEKVFMRDEECEARRPFSYVVRPSTPKPARRTYSEVTFVADPESSSKKASQSDNLYVRKGDMVYPYVPRKTVSRVAEDALNMIDKKLSGMINEKIKKIPRDVSVQADTEYVARRKVNRRDDYDNLMRKIRDVEEQLQDLFECARQIAPQERFPPKENELADLSKALSVKSTRDGGVDEIKVLEDAENVIMKAADDLRSKTVTKNLEITALTRRYARIYRYLNDLKSDGIFQDSEMYEPQNVFDESDFVGIDRRVGLPISSMLDQKRGDNSRRNKVDSSGKSLRKRLEGEREVEFEQSAEPLPSNLDGTQNDAGNKPSLKQIKKKVPANPPNPPTVNSSPADSSKQDTSGNARAEGNSDTSSEINTDTT